ncbi:MAG: xanthine dehydrogenase family protein subunit M [Pseudomonadota bacterium]
MYDVNFHKAKDAKDAAKLVKSGDDPMYLSGGMTLIPTMKARLAAPSDLVDVSAASDMVGITVKGSTITIGAATTHAEVASNAKLIKAVPGLACLAAGIGDPAVRHRGTIGGSIANNDPAADYPAAMLGLAATIVTNKRKISADKFFVGLFETALNEGELIKAVIVEKPKKSSYAKFPNPASRYAMVGVFVAKTAKGTRVAVTGAGGDGVFRMKKLEKALDKKWGPEALAGTQIGSEGLMSDMHGSAEYRANLIGVMAKRAIEAS